jgi:hypothetical protein
MHQRFTLRILISGFIIACGAGVIWLQFHGGGLPFSVTVSDTRTAVIHPAPGFKLPVSIQAGDRIDLQALDPSTRSAIVIFNSQGRLPLGRNYQFVIQRDGHRTVVPVTTVDLGVPLRIRLSQWLNIGFFALMSVLALLTLWRGRSRAATYMALWLTTYLLGSLCTFAHFDGVMGLIINLASYFGYILARISFYLMIETLVGKALAPRTLALVRISFILLIGVGAVVKMGGPIVYVTSGWAGLLLPALGIVFTAGYLVPAILLLLSYGRATLAQRPQVRWLLWSTAALLVSVFFSNTLVIDVETSAAAQSIFAVLCMFGIVYTVLRHRVVDVSVVIDRTLVYVSMTALVVGVLTAVNNLVQHVALDTHASLLLQVIVPLSLGIVLSRVRTYIKLIVERVFFRKKYLAEKAMRRFARHCAKYEQVDELFKMAVVEIHSHMGSLGVAIYERKGMDYDCVYQEGEVVYPKSCGIDDPAFVAARSEHRDANLAALHSILGNDGYVFPMIALSNLQGVLICANRPGEHYATDERKLLAYVAHQIGFSLYALRMRARDRLVDALASGMLSVSPEVQAKACEVLGT